jgi:hypothetical protein
MALKELPSVDASMTRGRRLSSISMDSLYSFTVSPGGISDILCRMIIAKAACAGITF